MKLATIVSKVFLILTILLFSLPAVTMADDATDEIEKLIDYIRISKCKFNRNGSWVEAVEAADHINAKYQYVQKKGLVKTAEDFIKYAATESSISGEAYIVKCDNAKPRKTAEWLTTILDQLHEIK